MTMETKDQTIEETAVAVKTDQEAMALEMEKVEVHDDATYSRAANWLSQIKARFKRIEEKRKEYVQPLNVQVRKINADFKAMQEPYIAMESTLKGKMVDYANKKERERQEAERKEREERAAEARRIAEEQRISNQKAAAQLREQRAKEEAEKPAPVAPKTVKTETAKVVTKKVVKFEITDPSKVPDEYKVVDERLVRQAVVQGGKRRIAGVRIWEEAQVSAF